MSNRQRNKIVAGIIFLFMFTLSFLALNQPTRATPQKNFATSTPQYDYLPVIARQYDNASQPTATATPLFHAYTLNVKKTITQTSIYQISNAGNSANQYTHHFHTENPPQNPPAYSFTEPLPSNTTRAYKLADLPLPPDFEGVVVIEAGVPIQAVHHFWDKNNGTIKGQDLVMDSISNGGLGRWQYNVAITDALTVNVSAELGMDMTISILNEENDILLTQNIAPPNQAEILRRFPLSKAGSYEIWAYEAQKMGGGISLLLQGNDHYPFVFNQTITNGAVISSSLPAAVDHFWHFSAVASDTITITVSPNATSDPFVELYNPTGVKTGSIDIGSAGVPEQASWQLQKTGFYVIRVGEFSFLPMTYTLSLDISP